MTVSVPSFSATEEVSVSPPANPVQAPPVTVEEEIPAPIVVKDAIPLTLLGPGDKTLSLEEVKCLRVELFPSAVVVHIGPGIEKVISYDSFFSLLGENRSVEDGSDNFSDGVWLPTGTYFFQQTKNSIKIATYHPACVRPISYISESKEPAVIPNIIVAAIIERSGSEWAVKDSFYFCTKRSLSEIPRHFPSTRDFSILPFNNMYENARMCFGSSSKISRFKLPDLRGFHSYYEVIFSSIFNNDLGIRAVKSSYYSDPTHGSLYKKWYALLRERAKNKEGFPYEALNVNN